MANETKRGGATKWLLIGGVLVGGACCLPVSCLVVVGSIGANAEDGKGPVVGALENTSQNARVLREKVEAFTEQAQQTGADMRGENRASETPAADAATKPSPTPRPTPTPKAPSPAKIDGEVRRVGEEFVLGNYSYRVTRWRAVDQIGNAFTSTKATPGGTFVIVECVMTNATNESQTIFSSDFKLRDTRGREFSTASKVEMALAMADPDNADMILTELQPGLSRTLRQGFEVPKDAVTGGGLVLVIPEKGLFGTKKALVRLE